MAHSQAIPSEVEMEPSPCPLGCPPGDEVFAFGVDRVSGLPGRFRVVRCAACGLLRTDPRPTPETMGYYYPDDYAPYQYTSAKIRRRPAKKPLWRRVARRVVEFNSDRLPPRASGHALELGCAGGGYLEHLANLGFSVEGVEPNARAAAVAAARGFRVQSAQVESMEPPEKAPDLIVGWMVLEHLHDPLGCLRRLHAWAAPGAWLAISVPNAGAWLARAFTERWYALQVPCHLFHFTPATLGRLLTLAGWRPEAFHHHRVLADYLTSSAHYAEDAGHAAMADGLRRVASRRAFVYATYPAALLAAGLGQTGRMTVWARRA
jgi:2-polyprenyl-3-methyl-5-hydroxy-6-metoxy-1,4-benzoquinol methylase